MSYSVILTATGAAKLAAGEVNIVEMAVGDASGAEYEPDGSETELVNEVHRASVSAYSVSGSRIFMQLTIPQNTGGFFIREAGAFDSDGDLIFIANVPTRYKSTTAEGATSDLSINLVSALGANANLSVTVDGSAYVTNGMLNEAFNFTASVDNAATITVHEALAKTLSVAFFGAVGDGVNDDTAAIQNAFNYVALSGGQLVFPPGIYKTTAGIVLNDVEQSIAVSGHGAMIDSSSFVGNALTVNGKTTDLGNILADVSKGGLSIQIAAELTLDDKVIIQQNQVTAINAEISFQKNALQTRQYATVFSEVFTEEMVGKSIVLVENGLVYGGFTALILEYVSATQVAVLTSNNNRYPPAAVDAAFTIPADDWGITELWAPARAYYWKGEILNIRAQTTSNTYSLQTPLYDSYLSARTGAIKIAAAQLKIAGLSFKGPRALVGGIVVANMGGIDISEVSVNGYRDRGISITNSININVNGSLVNDTGVTNQGTNYGLIIASCQNCNYTGGNYYGGRHAIAHGGTFPCRNMNVSNMMVNSFITWALDWHGNAEFINISNVIAPGGIYLGGINNNVCNVITSASLVPTIVFGPERSSDYCNLVNVITENISAAGALALAMSAQFQIAKIGDIKLSNVSAKSSNYYAFYMQSFAGYSYQAPGDTDFISLTPALMPSFMCSNTSMYSATGNAVFMDSNGVGTAVKLAVFNGCDFDSPNWQAFRFTLNPFFTQGGEGDYKHFQPVLRISNCRLNGNSTNDSYPVINITGCETIWFTDNDCDLNSPTSIVGYMLIQNFNNCFFKHNMVKNGTKFGGIYIPVTSDVQYLLANDNFYQNCAENPNINTLDIVGYTKNNNILLDTPNF